MNAIMPGTGEAVAGSPPSSNSSVQASHGQVLISWKGPDNPGEPVNNTNFTVMEKKDVSYQGHAYLLLKVGFASYDSKSENWCREYQNLCGSYGYSPTGCGPQWNNSGGYATCKNTYGSVAPDNSLNCNPSGTISSIASTAGYNDANTTNSFGFHSCTVSSCAKTLCSGQNCNAALSYIDKSKSHGYTVCIK